MNNIPVFPKTVGPAASGTATARTAIDSTFVVPSAAKELVGLWSFYMAEAPDPADSLLAVGDIKGTDFRYQPCEWLFPIASGKLGAIDNLETTPMRYYPIHAPMNGNEVLDIGIEPLSAVASDGQAGVTLLFSTRRTGKPTIYGKASREVATGTTAATQTAGTNITLSNARQMHSVWAVATTGTGTVVADEELAAKATMTCTVWREIQTLDFFCEPVHAIEATSGCTKVAGIMVVPCNLTFSDKQATIETVLENYDALSGAGIYAHGVRYYGV